MRVSQIAELAQSDPGRWPLLAEASRNERKALSRKVEWSADDGSGSLLRFNYVQMFRGSKEQILDEIEASLRGGVRDYETATPSYRMGSIASFGPGVPCLRVLRDLNPLDHPEISNYQWIAEVSVSVAPAGSKTASSA